MLGHNKETSSNLFSSYYNATLDEHCLYFYEKPSLAEHICQNFILIHDFAKLKGRMA